MISISYYYDYLIINNPEINNPAKAIRIKNPDKRIVHNLLTEKELILLYNSIDANDVRSIRNKVLLGFLVYQGISTRELHQLNMGDLRLRKGTVLIRGDTAKTRKRGSTSRELAWEALQIIDLLEYIKEIRSRILAGTYRYLPGRKPRKENLTRETDQLLLSIACSSNLKNSMIHLFKNLREHNPRVKNAMQIRQSVIASWLTKENLRKVQYYAGHRYVSSTEYYKQINLQDLKRKVCEHHPLV